MDLQAIDLSQMQESAVEAEQLLKTLANSHRLLILCHLVAGELTVGELEQQLNLSQSSLSQHLARMRRCGVLACRKEGTNVYYYVANSHALQVLQTLHGIYCSPK